MLRNNKSRRNRKGSKKKGKPMMNIWKIHNKYWWGSLDKEADLAISASLRGFDEVVIFSHTCAMLQLECLKRNVVLSGLGCAKCRLHNCVRIKDEIIYNQSNCNCGCMYLQRSVLLYGYFLCVAFVVYLL